MAVNAISDYIKSYFSNRKALMVRSWPMAKRTVDPAVSAAASAMGKLGGSRRVPKGFSSLTPEERSAVAKDAAAKRWAGVKKKGATKKKGGKKKTADK